MASDRKSDSKVELLLMGGSAGSLKVLLSLLPTLRQDLAFPVVIILHRKADPDSMLDVLLRNHTKLPVLEAEDKMTLQKGTIYLAPPDYHLLFESNKLVSLDYSEKLNYSRPSIDVSFQSAALACRDKLVAILLSGANADGVEGLKCVKSADGLVFVQDPDTAEVAYMPRQAIVHVKVDAVFKPEHFPGLINNL
ncbi:chemotaxis protein CheB [Sphingobacterium griseoflavum]|uniref:protein-glutamate methylesterase n=1 Tax=Sphingobacterium griseoflavum TaxID=1474952 RepID=A0ABQ3I0S8_9SPHI|nr:chemotaxis protein CheB [Sphingobacterium griseoflavum]GHE42483.1 putative chemotaxis protein-glutamate methylesterase [Sphingobacterium griseoflavum]